MENLDADVAAVVLPKAVSIALLDREVNPYEDRALTFFAGSHETIWGNPA